MAVGPVNTPTGPNATQQPPKTLDEKLAALKENMPTDPAAQKALTEAMMKDSLASAQKAAQQQMTSVQDLLKQRVEELKKQP